MASQQAQPTTARARQALTPTPASRGVLPMRTTRAMAKATGAEIIKPAWALRSPGKAASQRSSAITQHSSFLGLGVAPGGAPCAAQRRSSLEASDGLDVPQDPRREALRNSVVGRRSVSPPVASESTARSLSRKATVASNEKGASESKARRMLEAEKSERRSSSATLISASSPIKKTLSRPAVTTERISSRAGASRSAIRPASSPVKMNRSASPVKRASRTVTAPTEAERVDGLGRKPSSTRSTSTLPKSPMATRPVLKHATSEEDDNSLRSSPSFDSLLPPSVSSVCKTTCPTSARHGRRPLAAQRISQDQTSPHAEYGQPRSPSVSPTLARATLVPVRDSLSAHTPPRLRPTLAPGSLRPSSGSAMRGIFRHESESEEEHGVSGDEVKYLTPGPVIKSTKLGLQMVNENENHVSRSTPVRRVRAPLGSAKETRTPLEAATNVLAEAREPTTSLATIEAGLAKLALPRHRRTSSALGGDHSSPEDKKLELPHGVRDVLAPPTPRAGSPAKRTLGGAVRKPRDESSFSPIQSASSSIFAPRYPANAVLRTKIMPEQQAPASPPVRSKRSDKITASHGNNNDDDDETRAQATAEAEARRMAAEVVARVRQGRRKSLAAIKPLGLEDVPSVDGTSSHVDVEQGLLGGGESRPPTSEQRAERRAAKQQRRKSLYAYVPTKREDLLGNSDEVLPCSTSSGLVGSATTLTRTQQSSVSVVPSQRFLRGLRILVDVRDQDGEDASSAWVTMLKEWGARVFLRPPTLTPNGTNGLSHIVYKGGRPSTLHAFRSAPEPKPFLVGVSWVLRMLQEGKRTDETGYLVEVGKEAVFRKKRASMAPRAAPAADAELTLDALRNPAQEVALARKKELAHLPAQPSPLACAWRPGSSTSTEGGTSILN